MRILHINSYYSTSPLFHNLYQRQLELGNEVNVYVPIAKEYPEERIAVRGDYATVRRNHPKLSRWVFPWKHQLILRDLNQTFSNIQSFDLIHAHSLFSNGWLAYQLYRREQVPYIVAVRNADLRTFFQRMPWMRSTGIKIMQHAARIIFISKNTQKEVFERYIPDHLKQQLWDKSLVIANGIDTFWHENQPEEPHSSWHDPIKLVVTSKILRTKRLCELAELVETYSQTVRPAQLFVIGPPWDNKELERLQRYSCVTYLGPKNQTEMAEIYRSMDIYAMLSYPETFGLVYAEAMSQGLPVIYTQGEGFDNFFPNYSIGVSVQPKNQAAFNQAVDYICDPDHYSALSKRAQEAISVFNWDDITQQYQALYQQVKQEVN